MTSRPEYSLEGRRCVVSDVIRVRHTQKRWGFYNRVIICYLPEGDGFSAGSDSLPAGKFYSAAKPTGRKVFFNAGRWMEPRPQTTSEKVEVAPK